MAFDQDKYWASWYAKPDNKRRHKAASAERTEAVRATLRKMVADAKNVPCTDCGQRYQHWIMQFDHLPERPKKRFNISSITNKGYSLKTVKAEIEKCEVVCANCHSNRTYIRRIKSEARVRIPLGDSESCAPVV